jgi:flagellar capping protein FliD
MVFIAKETLDTQTADKDKEIATLKTQLTDKETELSTKRMLL